MWDWIIENSAALSVLISIGTIMVWIAYFQLLYASYRRQRRTRILINRGAGRGTGARCLISNMGAEPLYIMSIIARLEKDDRRVEAEITDLDSQEVSDGVASHEGTSQRPLKSGELMDIGQFSALMARCARASGESDENLEGRFDGLTLIVIAAYGAEDLSVGAERHFALKADAAQTTLDPPRISTTQLRSRRQRRRLEDLLYTYR